MATIAAAQQPVFSRVSIEEKNSYDLFMDYSSSTNIEGYAKGWNLEKLVDLAEKAYDVVAKSNPILQEGSPQSSVIPGRQWELNRLSDIKQRLAQAVEHKRGYYDNSIMGIITKYFLKCFGMWNDGETAAIVKAEDFLIRYDTRLPLFKDARGNYVSRCFFPLTSASWVRNTLDTTRFYNYNPRRAIPAVQNFRYDALDPNNPTIFIRG
ncbi:MAG: hypothetical protein JSS60_07580 [Verrucomicrobia bacterium]|nr:hypothetical protein [Verrucomicrobiota bacterium]